MVGGAQLAREEGGVAGAAVDREERVTDLQLLAECRQAADVEAVHARCQLGPVHGGGQRGAALDVHIILATASVLAPPPVSVGHQVDQLQPHGLVWPLLHEGDGAAAEAAPRLPQV